MLRRANGIAALVLLAVFAAHTVMGALFCLGMVSGELSWVVWVGVGIVAVHVALSADTTRQMLCDRSRPPSAKKRAHQTKKWVSGIAVGVVAVAHVLAIFQSLLWSAVTLALDVALVMHVCVCAKSLVKDLGLAPNWRHVIRVFVIAFYIFVGLAVAGLPMLV